MISYEIPMGISLLTVIFSAGTLSLDGDCRSAELPIGSFGRNPISFIIYLITAFAETNRAPFDLPEAEQELTAGYHTEYGGMKFAVFFLAEYVNILAVSAIAVTLFFGRMARAREYPGGVVSCQSGRFCLLFYVGAGHDGPLPLRPADELWLEGVDPHCDR